MNYPFKELDRELFGVCVCLNFLVWPWLWVFNMSGFLLPLGKDGAIVNYSLNWQVDWICGMDDEMLLKYSFFLCAADGLGHPHTCPGTASHEVELWIRHLTAVPQRKRVPFNWCISLDDQTVIEVVPQNEMKRNGGNEHSQYNNIRSSVIKYSEVLSWAVISLKRERHYGNLIDVGSAGILQSGVEVCDINHLRWYRHCCFNGVIW